jgi:hypothetical protein
VAVPVDSVLNPAVSTAHVAVAAPVPQRPREAPAIVVVLSPSGQPTRGRGRVNGRGTATGRGRGVAGRGQGCGDGERDPEVQPDRARLSDDERMALMKLCVANMDSHNKGSKQRFLDLISDLLYEETGVRLKNPFRSVNVIISHRREVIKWQAKESGKCLKCEGKCCFAKS